MIAVPPRLPRVLLSALGARPEFRDAVIGDLLEEYHLREEMHGESAARGWFLDEAYRAAPYLVRDGLTNLGVRGSAQVVGAVLEAYASIVVIGVTLSR